MRAIMARRTSRAILALSLAASFDASMADTGASTFFWGFNDSSISLNVAQCSQVPLHLIGLTPNSSLGVPPYYMIAFVPGGIPTTSFIGTDPFNLNWQVNQPSGSKLVLDVADANGGAGGQPLNTLTVTDGDSSCISSAEPTNLTLVANVSSSDPLQTCQPLGLVVKGGIKPYNMSIAALNSKVVTNVTLGADDDTLTWINRADPGSQLLVSVSDANGWGTSTGFFNTAGNTDTTCTGLSTTSSNSGAGVQPSAQPEPSATSTSHRSAIGVAAAISSALALILVCVGALLCYRRRRRRQRDARGPEYTLDAWPRPAPLASMGSASGASVGAGAASSLPYGSDDDSKRALDEARAPLLGDAGTGVPDGVHESSVIQHQDAEDSLTELPPPYVDRGLSADTNNRASSSCMPSVASGIPNAVGHFSGDEKSERPLF